MEFLKDIILLLITLSALVISILTFFRQKTLENENQLFKYKIEKYNELLKMMQELVIFFRKEITDFYLKTKKGQVTGEEITKKAEAIDAKAAVVQTELILASAFLPDDVVSEIDDFLDEVFGDFFFNVDESEFSQALEILDKLEDKLIEVSYAMRDDLGIDSLHKKLVRRTR